MLSLMMRPLNPISVLSFPMYSAFSCILTPLREEWLIMIVLRAVAIAIADPTLWYRPRQALRFLVGLPVREDRTAEEEVEENSSAELKAGEGTGSSAGPEDSVDTGSGEAGVSGGEPADRVDQDNEPVVVLDHVDKSYNGRAVLTGWKLGDYPKGTIRLNISAYLAGYTECTEQVEGLIR